MMVLILTYKPCVLVHASSGYIYTTKEDLARNMSVTLKDVAAYAGVSRGTVDRVIYGRGIVNSETRKKVLQALDDLNYSPNVSARALVLSRQQNGIGVIIPDQPGFFHDEVLRGLKDGMKECVGMGITVRIKECDANKRDQYIHAIDAMYADGIRAFALSGQNTKPLIDKIDALAEEEIPVITINSDIPESRRAAFVGEDSRKSGRIAGQMMAKMLASPGSVLVIGGRSEYAAHTNRVGGFLDALKEHASFEMSCEAVYTYEDYDQTYQRVLQALSGASLRGVYLATSSVSAYVDAKRHYEESSGRPLGLVSICHDIPPQTLEYIRSGDIDLTIEQNIYRQGFKPLQMLRDHLLNGEQIQQEEIRTFYNILSSECI